MAFLTIHLKNKTPLKVQIDVPCSAFSAYNKACDLHGLIPKTKYCANGSCGKCSVRIFGNLSKVTDAELKNISQQDLNDGIRLLCQTTILGNAEIFADYSVENMQIEVNGYINHITEFADYKGFGIALDIGTTTIAGLLFKNRSKAPLSLSVLPNPQRIFGADVIARINASMEGHSSELFVLIRDSIDDIIEDLCKKAGCNTEDIGKICISANTTMLYLLTQKDCTSISKSPFYADCLFGFELEAGNLNGLNDGLKKVSFNVPVFLAPCVSAFIGSDTVACILSLNIVQHKTPVMIADLGTNSEMVLFVPSKNGEQAKILCTSSAAGPAFEGANISCGMCAINGAIEKIDVVGGNAACSVIGNVEPAGLCGSGLLDAIAVLRQAGQLYETGSFVINNDEENSESEDEIFEILNFENEEKAIIYRKNSNIIYLSQNDVRAFQLAKASLRAGLECLVNVVAKSFSDVEILYLVGGFAKSFNVANAVYVGLFPNELSKKIKTGGNASLMGAALMLQEKTSIKKACDIASKANVLELGGSELFQKIFIDSMNLKSTN